MNKTELQVGKKVWLSVAYDDGGLIVTTKLTECKVQTIDGKEVITLIFESDE